MHDGVTGGDARDKRQTNTTVEENLYRSEERGLKEERIITEARRETRSRRETSEKYASYKQKTIENDNDAQPVKKWRDKQ